MQTGRSASSSKARTSSHAQQHASSWSESHSLTQSRASSIGRGQTGGTSNSRGSSEALEPILENLPSAVHGKDTALYLAAQRLRTLATGEAFLELCRPAWSNSRTGPYRPLRDDTFSAEDFSRLREGVLARSSAALDTPKAIAAIAERQKAATDAAGETGEPETAKGYRVRKQRPARKVSSRGGV